MNYQFQGANQSDGMAAERAAYKAKCDELRATLPPGAWERIDKDPMGDEARAFYRRVDETTSPHGSGE